MPNYRPSPNLRDVIALVLIAAGIAMTQSPAHAQEAAPAGGARNTNRLIDSNNPYLLLHAHNPVDWYPWGPEALEKARREQKPIFLSVGYSTCYWCHVAEETIYSKQEFADLMNAWFVNIKVDREQRPDIDRLYMAATQAMTGRGGWPNNVFLTPDLNPIFAGSYFPPHDDGSGRPSFDAIIKSIHASWTRDPERVRAKAQRMMAVLREQQAMPALANARIDPGVLVQRSVATWTQRADPEHGGFGTAKGARFPVQPVLSLLMDEAVGSHNDILARALDAMAAGGIYDHLAGGFHRYAVEPTWSVPHFEKMLGDNAQLLAIYANAFVLTNNPRYRMVATQVADYLTTQMQAAEGGFYTAQDAAVNGEEGVSYLWTRQEIVAVLGEEAATRFFAVYKMTPLADSPSDAQAVDDGGPGVLRLRPPLGESSERSAWQNELQLISAAAPLRAQLLEARNRRPQPQRDEKLVVALNGLAIQAFARTGQWLEQPRYVEVARRAAEHIWQVAWDPVTGLRHEIFRGRAQTDAFLDDYALLALSMLALHDATADPIWLARAGQLADAMLARFQRADGSLATTTAEKDLPMSPPEEGDTLQPSGSSAAIDLLLRLQRSTGAARYKDAAQRIVGHFGARLEDAPESWPGLLLALTAKPGVGTLAAGSVPSTQSVVHAAATLKSAPDHDEILVTLHIDDGYHVNANPASYAYLIATSVAFDGQTPTLVRYPQATLFKPAFAPAGLKVYEGNVTLVAVFSKGTMRKDRPLSATVSTQACDSEVCLPPAKLTVQITGE